MASLRALECLVTIVEQGSLTRAAARLHMSQPALSHRIAALERELGTPVLERLPRGIRPTAAGRAAAAEARVALAAAGRVVLAGRRAAAGASGRIRIASAETMTAWALAPVLRSWQRRFPAVELDLAEYASADQMLAVLRDGGTDIAVGPQPTCSEEHTEVLGREEIVVVAAPEHRFSRMGAVPLGEVSAEPLVHYYPGHGFGTWVDQFAAGHDVLLPRPALRTGSPRTAAQLAAAGMGVTIVPFSALAPRPDGTVRSLDPPELREVIAAVAAPHDDLLRRIDIRQTSRHLVARSGDRVIADTSRPLALYESGFAPRWYVPRDDIDETALTLAAGQTFCPYKGLCSYYDIQDSRRAAWSYPDAYTEVRRISGLISFEPDKIEVYLDGTRQRLEPGQAVVPHGIDRDLTTGEGVMSSWRPPRSG